MLPRLLSHDHCQPHLADDSPYGSDFDQTRTAEYQHRNPRLADVEAARWVEPLLLLEL